MKRQLIASVSAIALLFGAATVATAAEKSAQDKPMQDKATQSDTMKRSTDTTSEMKKKPATQGTTATETRARSGDTSAMRSYNDNKDAYADAKSAGGRSADELIGADIVNADGDEIGEIQDLVVGPDNNITKAIVEVGGFLGMGSKFVAVDIDQLQAGKKEGGYQTSLTKEQLKSNTEYKKENGHWMQSYK